MFDLHGWLLYAYFVMFTSDEILNKEVDLRKLMNSLESYENIELLKKSRI